MPDDEIVPLWNVDDVATFLRVPPGTVRTWVFKRTIPFVKLGRLLRFHPEEIRAWVASGHTPATALKSGSPLVEDMKRRLKNPRPDRRQSR